MNVVPDPPVCTETLICPFCENQTECSPQVSADTRMKCKQCGNVFPAEQFRGVRRVSLPRENSPRQSVCTNCGQVGNGVRTTPGRLEIEFALWLPYLVFVGYVVSSDIHPTLAGRLIIYALPLAFPGFVYSIWRFSSKFRACHSCGQRTLIPAASPRGIQILNDYQSRG